MTPDAADTRPARYTLDDLLAIMAQLRDPENGCPWDVAQDFASIAPYTIEEAYEVDDAIRRGAMDDLKSELGDLLLQVVFHARMAEEADLFSFADVADTIAAKMVRRHPHVFGNASIEDADAQTRAWEAQKADEREARARTQGRAPSVLDDVAHGLPALLRAIKIQKRAARVGFDWPRADQVLDKITEELSELKDAQDRDEGQARVSEEFGDLMFAVANYARHLNLDPEQSLRDANAKFERRFKEMESRLKAADTPLESTTLGEMEGMWQQVKAAEKGTEPP